MADMSGFDEWYRNRDAAFLSPTETSVEYDKRLGREAWNAALDQLEGLAEKWRTAGLDEPNDFAEDGCANELLARIKELRNESPRE